MSDKFPSWAYGPNGQSGIFDSEAEIPAGWVDHPTKVKSAAAPASKPKTAPAGGDAAELDAHGHPFNPELHAATKSKTTAGLWRMKVGVSRPAPMPGYPLDL